MALRKHSPQTFLLVALDWATIVGSIIAAIILRGRSFHGDVAMLNLPFFDTPFYAE